MFRLPSRAALAAVVVLSSAPAAAQPDAPVLHVAPTSVEVGMLFRGATVHVEGIAPPHRRLALLCVGKHDKVELKRKGKVWNALWMNVGSIAFERVPSLLHAYADVDPAAANGEALPSELRLGLGSDGVESHVLPPTADETTHRLFREFVRLKMQEGLYSFGKLRAERLGADGASGGAPAAAPFARVAVGGASVQGRSAPGPAADLALPTHISADFELPASIPPGDYEIRMIGYWDGTAELLASETLTARRVGLALLISSLAEHHGLLYGIFSVLIAVAAGFLTGMIFASAKKGH